jgi:hypothetical protein
VLKAERGAKETVTARPACCCSPPISCVASRNMGFLAQHRWRMRGAAGVAGEDTANYGDEVILLSISLSPTLLVCYVWYLQMVIHCVFLRKARDLVRDSIRKTSRKILWNCRQLWMHLHVWTTQEKHLSLICMCFFSWHHRFKHVTNYQFCFL